MKAQHNRTAVNELAAVPDPIAGVPANRLHHVRTLFADKATLGSWHETLDRVVKALEGETLAVMVYGSYARMTATQSSDIDVLQVVARSPRSYMRGPVSVTGYLPSHLKIMAASGSLFVLHLMAEGLVVDDSHGVLQRCLQMYRQPSDYSRHVAEIAAAGSALRLSDDDFRHHGQAIARLGIYLVRTAAYIRCIQRGTTTFDLAYVVRILKVPLLEAVLNLRTRQLPFENAELVAIRDCLRQLVPDACATTNSSLEALAISLAREFPRASGLIAAALAGGQRIDYAAGVPVLL